MCLCVCVSMKCLSEQQHLFCVLLLIFESWNGTLHYFNKLRNRTVWSTWQRDWTNLNKTYTHFNSHTHTHSCESGRLKVTFNLRLVSLFNFMIVIVCMCEWCSFWMKTVDFDLNAKFGRLTTCRSLKICILSILLAKMWFNSLFQNESRSSH